MTASLSHGTDFQSVVGNLAAFYVLCVMAITAIRFGWALLNRAAHLALRAAGIAGEALAVVVAWPFEYGIDQSDKWVAMAAEWRAQRKIWRREFRTKMPWDEFRRQMTGQRKAERDDYADALNLFGLTESFTRQDMDARFRRIMQGVHPDTGGTEYLAQQVTTARAVILKRKGWKK